eukprot:SAG22_NODE_27_length_29018_cov_465.809646_13_plen_235_part_00
MLRPASGAVLEPEDGLKVGEWVVGAGGNDRVKEVDWEDESVEAAHFRHSDYDLRAPPPAQQLAHERRLQRQERRAAAAAPPPPPSQQPVSIADIDAWADGTDSDGDDDSRGDGAGADTGGGGAEAYNIFEAPPRASRASRAARKRGRAAAAGPRPPAAPPPAQKARRLAAAAAGGGVAAGPPALLRRPPRRFSALQWNVWFKDRVLADRMRAVGRAITGSCGRYCRSHEPPSQS